MKLQKLYSLFAPLAFLLLIGIVFLRGSVRLILFLIFVTLMLVKYSSRRKKGISFFKRTDNSGDN